MRKHLRTLLCLLLLSCLLCVSVYAAEETADISAAGQMQSLSLTEQELAAFSAQTQSITISETEKQRVWTLMRNGLNELKTEIQIPCTNLDNVKANAYVQLYLLLLKRDPTLFYVEGSISAKYSSSMLRLYPQYSTTNRVYIAERQTQLTEKIDEIISGVQPGWSDLEKALYLHDYLALHAEYDTDSSDGITYDACTLLLDGVGVCEAYTRAYLALMDRVQIPCETVSSRDRSHTWNVIRIGGNWYHVDVTWDDPTRDHIGQVYHTNFCVSETQIRALGHDANDWEYSEEITAANDTTFDSCYWTNGENMRSAFVPIGDMWYYLNGSDIMQTSDPKKPGTAIKNIYAKWWTVAGTGWWPGMYAGLSVYDGKLVYNSPDAVYSYDAATEKTETLYELNAEEKQTGRIYGCMVTGNILRYTLLDTPNKADVVKTHQIDPYITVEEGGYAYYLENGHTLFLRRSAAETSGHVIAAWYDAEGRMLGARFLTGRELTVDLSGAAAAKIFSTDQSFAPRTFPLLQQAG